MPPDNIAAYEGEYWHEILLTSTFLLPEMAQVDRRALDLVSSVRTGGKESNCLREVSDKESVRIGLDAWVLFARRQVGKEGVG